MPGAGKSTIGVVLAKVLGYQFLDSDLLIQKQEKRRLSEIIEEEGYKGFKDVENRVNASIEMRALHRLPFLSVRSAPVLLTNGCLRLVCEAPPLF